MEHDMHLIPANPQTVNHLLAAYAIATPERAVLAHDQLVAALLPSMQNTARYGIAMDAPLVPNTGLGDMVHPYNLAAGVLALRHTVREHNVTLAPVDTLLLYVDGEWRPLGQCTTQGVVAPIIAPPAPQAPVPPVAPPVAPTEPAVAATAALDAFAGTPAALVTPGTQPAVGDAPAAAVLQTHQPGSQEHAVAAPVVPTVGKTIELSPTTSVHIEGGPSDHAHTALPPLNITRSVVSASNKPIKSPFDREYRPRERLGKAPSWWAETVGMIEGLFSTDPATLVPVVNSPSAVMSFGLTVDLAERLLSAAPGGATVAELRQWIINLQSQIGTSASAPVVFALADDLNRQRMEAAALTAKEGTPE